MKRISFLTIIICLAILALSGSAWAQGAVSLPKTGQTTSYATGDDGDLEMGVAWPDTRFTDNLNNTVKDNLTGLVWTKNANLPGGTLTWQAALDYVAGMNAGTYENFGYTDWRLPNVNELKSLIDNSKYDLALPQGQPFTNVQSYYYWSSTTNAYYTDYAWFVNMSYGYVSYDYKSNDSNYAWPVRSGQCGSFGDSVICLPKTGQTTSYATGDDGDLEMGVAWPDTRFTDNLDNTVEDNLTGLVWSKNANLPGGALTWQAALDYVAGMNAGTHPNFGYTDWRLPNVNELKSLTDNSRYSPALPQGHPFTNVQSRWYWSSTTFANSTDVAWNVYVDFGYLDDSEKSDNGIVWPVRSGQGGGSTTTTTVQPTTTSVIPLTTTTTAPPTVVTLTGFKAVPDNSSVTLVWSTATEIDNAGFNLYRAESENGQYTKINTSLIPAQGTSTQGANYEFIDKDVKNRKIYYYKLEDIDLNGNSTMHGPVSATPRLIFGLGK